MKIMFMANAPWAATGYGVQGRHLVPRLQDAGHEAAYFAFYGLQGGVLQNDGTIVYPPGMDPWGRDILAAHMRHFGADILVSLFDVWVYDDWAKTLEGNGWRWYPWVPIDHSPTPKRVREALGSATTALAMSQFGFRQLQDEGFANIRYIPHAVDSTVYHPMTQEEKLEARRQFRIPEDAFVIGTVAANKGYPSRKAFPELLRAFARFKIGRPDAVLYIHSYTGTGMEGVDLLALCEALGLSPGTDVLFSAQYNVIIGYPEAQMARLYNCFDLFSLVSMAEGFGIPLIEAQACGIPVVTATWTAMGELCGAGWTVQRHLPFWTPLNSWTNLPDYQDIAAKFAEAYTVLQDSQKRRDLSARARTFALKYDWDTVFSAYWQPFLESLEEEL